MPDVRPMRHKEERPARPWRFLFRSDSLALNFVATVAGPGSRPNGKERLTEPALLERWFREARLTPAARPVQMQDLDRAKQLREAIFRIADSRLTKAGIVDADIALINNIAAVPFAPVRLGTDGRTPQQLTPIGVDSLLGLIARDAIEVFSGPYGDRIKQCASPRCPIFFVDRSRSGNRKWCAMSPCGDQASAKAYRKRKRLEHAGESEPYKEMPAADRSSAPSSKSKTAAT